MTNDSLSAALEWYHKGNPANPSDPAFDQALRLLTEIIDAAVQADDRSGAASEADIGLDTNRFKANSNRAADRVTRADGARNVRWHIHYLRDQLPEAIADLDEILLSSPNQRNALYNRGFVYHHMHNYALASADFTEAIRIAEEFDDGDLIDAAEDHLNELASKL